MRNGETPQYIAKARTTFLVANARVPTLDTEAESCLRGWRITQLFYAALFWVKAYFIENEIPDVASHWQRLRLIGETEEIQHLETTFRVLQLLSFNARYELSYPANEDLQKALEHYHEFADEIEMLLSPENDPDDEAGPEIPEIDESD